MFLLTSTDTHTTIGDKSFAAADAHLCKCLPSALCAHDLSYGEFKRILKTFLFSLDRDTGRLFVIICTLKITLLTN